MNIYNPLFRLTSIHNQRCTKTLIGGYELLTSEFATRTRKTMRVCLLTCWLNVNATGRSFHEARGHVLVLILLRESRVLVTHQPVLKKENDFILKCRFVLQRVCLDIQYPLQVSQLNNTMIYIINFEDNKRLLSLHSQYQQISTQMMQ